jgi:hypothetical protein
VWQTDGEGLYEDQGDVDGPWMLKHPSELGSIAIAAKNLLLKDSPAPRLLQSLELQVKVLVKS